MNRYKKMHELWVSNTERFANGKSDSKGIGFTREGIDELTRAVATYAKECEEILRASWEEAEKSAPLGRQLVRR
jgi:hypothetical protein